MKILRAQVALSDDVWTDAMLDTWLYEKLPEPIQRNIIGSCFYYSGYVYLQVEHKATIGWFKITLNAEVVR